MNLLNILSPEIAFDGWAIGIIIFILTLLCSGAGAGVYVKRIKIKQRQKAGKKAKQKQKISSSTLKDDSEVIQKQMAGDNSQQEQII